jgi:hypothetical protein
VTKPLAVALRLDRNIIPETDEIRLFAKIRNEANKLPFWISYYRKLGVNRFFIVDNDSTDHTVESLSKDKDVHIFSTSEKMSAARGGMDWIEPLLQQHGQNRWCLIVDADELLVYPDSERIPLRELCQMLDQINADGFFCLLIDMYPDRNINEVTYLPGQSFLEVCPFFDHSGYQCLWSGPNGPLVVGGPRLRTFYPEHQAGIHWRFLRRIRAYSGKPISDPPLLNKVPLVRWNNHMSFGPAAHYLRRAHLAKGNGALLHFKFLGDFIDRVEEELVRKAYFNEGEHYQSYFRRLRARGNRIRKIDLMCKRSVRFDNSQQLVKLGLITYPAI